jgi:type IV pilus assembly protein PilA
LVELLAVIVILGIIAAIAVPAIGNIIEHSKQEALEQTQLMILDAADLYLLQHMQKGQAAPATLTVQQLVDHGFLKSIPTDPMTNESMGNWGITHDGKTATEVHPPTGGSV